MLPTLGYMTKLQTSYNYVDSKPRKILQGYVPDLRTNAVGQRGSAVERQSLASVLSPSCARPVADG